MVNRTLGIHCNKNAYKEHSLCIKGYFFGPRKVTQSVLYLRQLSYPMSISKDLFWSILEKDRDLSENDYRISQITDENDDFSLMSILKEFQAFVN